MRLLFDQGTPAPLRNHLPHHTVETAYDDELAAHQGDVTRVAHAIDDLHAGGYEEIALP
jgi:hypothetical protein